jgi:hypothetical protein
MLLHSFVSVASEQKSVLLHSLVSVASEQKSVLLHSFASVASEQKSVLLHTFVSEIRNFAIQCNNFCDRRHLMMAVFSRTM